MGTIVVAFLALVNIYFANLFYRFRRSSKMTSVGESLHEEYLMSETQVGVKKIQTWIGAYIVLAVIEVIGYIVIRTALAMMFPAMAPQY